MRKRNGFILLAIFLGTVLVNIIAWNSATFCDYYVQYIFPLWVNTIGRINGLWSFSVGEIMVVMGVVLIVAAIILGFIAAVFYLIAIRPNLRHTMKRICTIFYKGVAWTVVVLFAVMTCNCFILYHCSTFEEKYMETKADEYTLEELILLRDYMVEKVNTLALSLERDEYGNVIFSGDMNETAITAMQNLGGQYEQLSGFYPTPKEITTSGFLSQQHMKGYYFPFSMEANYNAQMYRMNVPATICHELAHVKGFIYEDEANLIGFMACVQSDDPYFQYSGYLSVLNYIDHDFYDSIYQNRKVYQAHVSISPQVKRDNVFLTEEAWEKVEEKAVIKTATVKKLSEEFIETNLIVNGIEDGSLSYGRVVGLLLHYYHDNVDSYAQKESMALAK
ncbi:MAG: DUF3810 domain-containing protein [Lachnospiraceae bacterium]